MPGSIWYIYIGVACLVMTCIYALEVDKKLADAYYGGSAEGDVATFLIGIFWPIMLVFALVFGIAIVIGSVPKIIGLQLRKIVLKVVQGKKKS